jgi:hypothetical protein
MIGYGFVKLVPVQFGRFGLPILTLPWGEMRQYWVLWTFMAYSPAYTMFAGAVEVLAGILLFFRRTAMLGALIALAAMTNVLMLDIGYGVSVKLFAANLVFASLFLLHYDAQRLLDVFIRGRPTSPESPLKSASGGRWHIAAAIALLVVVIAMNLTWSLRRYRDFDADVANTRVVNGLYDVAEVRTGGNSLPLVLGDNRLWKRVAIQGRTVVVDLMSDSVQFFAARVDSVRRELHLTLRDIDHDRPPVDSLTFAYDRPNTDWMALRGVLNGRTVTISLRRFDEKRYRLARARPHWFDE